MIEPCNRANGSNLIADFVAARAILLRGSDCDELSLRSNNDISRHCNALLRALRHGVCSYLNTSSEEMECDDDFRTHANNLLSVISASYSVDKICQLIRTALSIQRKSPSTVFKAFDPVTGRVFVDKYEVPKEIWGRLIPSALEKIRPAFYKLFRCPELLDKLLNVKNAFVWDEERSKVIVQNGADREVVPLVSAVPSFDIEDAQKCIDICYSVDRFSHAYLSFGACRASELDRMTFKQSQVIFNHLRFQVSNVDSNATTSLLFWPTSLFCTDWFKKGADTRPYPIKYGRTLDVPITVPICCSSMACCVPKHPRTSDKTETRPCEQSYLTCLQGAAQSRQQSRQQDC